MYPYFYVRRNYGQEAGYVDCHGLDYRKLRNRIQVHIGLLISLLRSAQSFKQPPSLFPTS